MTQFKHTIDPFFSTNLQLDPINEELLFSFFLLFHTKQNNNILTEKIVSPDFPIAPCLSRWFIYCYHSANFTSFSLSVPKWSKYSNNLICLLKYRESMFLFKRHQILEIITRNNRVTFELRRQKYISTVKFTLFQKNLFQRYLP
jgi:hypothetical protein